MKKAASSTNSPSTVAAAKSSGEAAAVRAFRKIADAYLEETFERVPEYASQLGLKAFESRLSQNTPAEHQAQSRLVAKTLEAVEALPEAAFSSDDWLDRRAFLAQLRTDHLFDATFERWRNNPQIHASAAIESVFDLIVRNTANLRPVAASIEARLTKIPDFLEAAAACVRAPVPLWAELAVKVCQGGCEFLDGITLELTAASRQPDAIPGLVAAASRALNHFASVIERKKRGPANAYSIGRDAFELLVRERLGIVRALPELEADGRLLVEELCAELEAEARKHGKRTAEEIIETARSAWTPAVPLLDAYREVTERIKGRVVELGLATLPPGESLEVLPVPPFLRHQFPTAAYHQPPAFGKRQAGIFWVNDLSLQQAGAAKKLAEVRQHYGLELTAAHEAYPGHHLQFAVQNRHPSKLRRLFAHAIFYEGWTLWCEKMCVDQGLVDIPGVRLMQLHDALWRAYRILIDCGLHSGTLTFNGACKVLMDGVGFTKARAQGDVNWYTSSPTVPMSYLLGRLEVERLYRHFVEGEGWSLRQFNDWMLSHGAVPWSWILEARMRR